MLFMNMSLDCFYKMCACVLSFCLFLDLIVGAFGTGKVAVYRYVVCGMQMSSNCFKCISFLLLVSPSRVCPNYLFWRTFIRCSF